MIEETKQGHRITELAGHEQNADRRQNRIINTFTFENVVQIVVYLVIVLLAIGAERMTLNDDTRRIENLEAKDDRMQENISQIRESQARTESTVMAIKEAVDRQK